MLEIGSLVDGKYRILSKCGQGGMSVVYMARNERANKTWAIKEIRKDGTQNFEVVKQGLIVETDMLKRLNHPHLPSIIDVIDGDGSFLIVMDFIEGKTLKEILSEYGAQPQESVVDWAMQLCDVLGYLHSRQPAIIYRDMKPSNVMLKPDGNVVLFDFGTAREYKSASLEDTTCLGTRGYAAPEQYGGRGQTDARTDIFCLGATMYHMITGHNPSEPPYEMYPITTWNPNLSKGLEAIILKCTQNNPADRYQSCAELLYALQNYKEQDVEFRKKQLSKFTRFMIPAVMTLVFGVGAITFSTMENHVKQSNYDTYIGNAQKATLKADEINYYKMAINLDPSRGEAYMGLITEAFLDDGEFTSQESEELRAILLEEGNGSRTNEKVFEENTQEYEEFAYEVGLAYYYNFEEKSNKKNAKAYFEIAMDSEYLSDSQRERAKRLYKISDYYNKIGAVNEAGDASITYRDYWNDLTELSEGNLVSIDNERTALVVYESFVAQIITRANEFKSAGVTYEEMEAQLSNMESHLQTDFTSSYESEITKLQEAIEQARRIVVSAYSQTN